MPGTIAVVGATGFTGRLVVADLAGRDASLRLVGRDRGRLEDAAGDSGAEVRVSSWNRGALTAALDGCAAVISCAGPFMEVGGPVVQAAVDAGVPYTDSTGEQAFIRQVYEGLDRDAQRAGIVLAPAFGFDYVPGDLGAAIAAEGLGDLERIDVVYAVERGDTSVGTRRSAIGIMLDPGYQWLDGELRRARVGAHRRTVTTQFGRRTGGSIPGGEPLMVPRHLAVATVVSHLAVPGALSPANRGASLLPVAARAPGMRGLLDRAAARGTAGPEGEARRARVACVVQAEARDGRRRAVRVEGRDPYGFTARSLGELAVRMRDGAIDAAGVRSPAEIVEARSFLAATGLTVVDVDPE